MQKSILSRLGLALAVVALGSASASAQGYMGDGYGRGYYAPPAYYAPPPPYGYFAPPAYGYYPAPAYGYYAPLNYGSPVYDYSPSPPSNPYFIGTRAWWAEQERLRD
jgi:hypothetical protein